MAEELVNNCNMFIKCEPNSTVSDFKGNHKFTFDRIFGSEAGQVDVFKEVAVPACDGVFNGYNGTIFAYG